MFLFFSPTTSPSPESPSVRMRCYLIPGGSSARGDQQTNRRKGGHHDHDASFDELPKEEPDAVDGLIRMIFKSGQRNDETADHHD